MALRDFQTALGRMIQARRAEDPLQGLALTPEERARLTALTASVGFHFTVSIQRSWCTGRAAMSAHLTLSLLPEDQRTRLLEEWTHSGAGAQSFIGVEALAFLEFIGSHLPAPSHEQTLCRFEQATLRAGQGADVFIAPDLGKWNTPGRLLRRGRSAGLVRFHAEPNALFRAILQQEPLPPLTPNAMVLLFGPGLERLCRPASEDEVRLWERLVTSVSVRALREEGYSLETLAALLNAGALEYADYPPL
ncbi:MAG TPA: hypothetical protein VKU00_24215 [Chthonomonadaceae bacterium]|nr:hypothetical protein [Chthonomonadaceae bacterium]